MSNDLTAAAALRTLVFSNNAPATPVPASPASPASTAPATPVEPYAPAHLSPPHVAQWIEWEKENLVTGKITPEEATRRFDALGATPEQRAPDTRSADVKLLDQHFPVAKPEEFLIRYAAPGQPAPTMTPAMREFDHSARTWLSQAEFPRDLGNSLVTAIDRVTQQTKAMTPEQLESYGMVEFEKLKRAYGGEDPLQEKLRAAAVMIDAIEQKTPGLKQLLQSRGIGDNALIVAQLIGQAERWHARKGTLSDEGRPFGRRRSSSRLMAAGHISGHSAPVPLDSVTVTS